MSPRDLAAALPKFPWDSLSGAKATAAAHPDGIVDLSVGTPVDPTPTIVSDALRAAADSWAGYPTVAGTPALREAIRSYLSTRWNAACSDDEVLPVVGTKELIASLALHLGLGTGDLVIFPTLAYPTYEVGGALAGTTMARADDPADVEGDPALIWINSPGNPHGAIADVELQRRWVQFARDKGAILVADECYGEFGWDAEPVSVLDPQICDGSFENILAVFSLSKRSNLAGYRAGWIAGDQKLVATLLGLRKNLGLMVAGPVQDAMIAALGDHDHVEVQRQRYLTRRTKLRAALESVGFQIDHSEGSLYLWATRGDSGRDAVDWLATRGILCAPGDFYGVTESDRSHVRIALTATDERIKAACGRLAD